MGFRRGSVGRRGTVGGKSCRHLRAGPRAGPASLRLIQLLLQGDPPLLPRASFAVVDVRDVADLHLRAMLKPEAAGQRLLASAGQPLKLLEIAAILRAALGDGGARIPTREVPDS